MESRLKGYLFFEDGDYPMEQVYDGVRYYFKEETEKWGIYVSAGGCRINFTKMDIWLAELDEIRKQKRHERYLADKAKAKKKLEEAVKNSV
ncbi:hypothetical protein [Thomasclavelia sp.]|uniref:hypothetical protein n=1 Tax=Thomasclavelia sp. TaxID=3025757 RepID=UPI0025F7F769|nr:hypothetical protein [Thomasclavelia sp.]